MTSSADDAIQLRRQWWRCALVHRRLRVCDVTRRCLFREMSRRVGDHVWQPVASPDTTQRFRLHMTSRSDVDIRDVTQRSRLHTTSRRDVDLRTTQRCKFTPDVTQRRRLHLPLRSDVEYTRLHAATSITRDVTRRCRLLHAMTSRGDVSVPTSPTRTPSPRRGRRWRGGSSGSARPTPRCTRSGPPAGARTVRAGARGTARCWAARRSRTGWTACRPACGRPCCRRRPPACRGCTCSRGTTTVYLHSTAQRRRQQNAHSRSWTDARNFYSRTFWQ